jgi:microcystin-dependent protein
MSDPFIGEIRAFPYMNFVPDSWALCDGSTLSITKYSVLYAIIGTAFGGNGTTTFNLPDLRQRIAVGPGVAAGDANPVTVVLGQQLGGDTAVLTAVPLHTHQMEKKTIAGGAGAKTNTPSSTSDFGQLTSGTTTYLTFSEGANATDNLDPGTLTPAGAVNVQGHENRQPFLSMFYAIALQGIYPPRS